MAMLIDLILVGGGVLLLLTGLVIRKVSGAVSKGTEYVYNAGVMTRLSEFTAVKGAELKKHMLTTKLIAEDAALTRHDDDGIMGKVIRFASKGK